MRFVHTMVRVKDLDASLDFYCNKFGLVEMRRKDVEAGRFTLVFLAAPKDQDRSRADAAPGACDDDGFSHLIRPFLPKS